MTRKLLFQTTGLLVAVFFFYLAFTPRPGSWALAFAGISLLLCFSAGWSTRVRSAGLAGLFFGFTFYFIELFWITNSISGFTSLPRPLVIVIMALLALYMALFTALFTALWGWLRKRHPAPGIIREFIITLTLAGAWVVLEEFRSRFLGGFPWHPLGLTQINNPLLTPLLPYGGVRLLSGLVVFGGVCFAYGVRDLARGGFGRSAFYALLLAGALFGPSQVLSGPAVSVIQLPGEESIPSRVLVVQPNIPQAEKWRPENREKIVAKMFSMTRQGLAEKPDLVVWPEAALPLLLERKPELGRRIQALVDANGCALMLGGPRYLREREGAEKSPPKLYNAVFFFAPRRPVAVYNKVKLVPYGEFTPLAEFLPFIGKLVPGLNYSAGSRVVKFAWKKLEIAPSVCFEGVFPAFTARFFKNGANLLVNLTNDAWFGDSPGPRQHLLNIRLRALENQTWIVRCANTGISAAINPAGEIVKFLPLNQEGLLLAEVEPAPGPTFFARHPLLSPAIAGILFIVGLGLPAGRRQPEALPG